MLNELIQVEDNNASNLSNNKQFPYIDRELSWLQFNHRVLDLVSSGNVPILEQIKFLSITNSNLDEFFSIRVATRLKELDNKPIAFRILKECRNLLERIDTNYEELLLRLKKYNINIVNPYIDIKKKDINTEKEVTENKIVDISNESNYDSKEIFKYFKYNIQPSLTPLILDDTRPIPHLKPFSIYIALVVKNHAERIGLIEVPPQLERIIKFGNKENRKWYFIEDIIIANLDQLYPGMGYSDVTAFRILRDSDTAEIEEAKYVESMIKHVRSRVLFNEPVRVDIWGFPRKKIINMIKVSLDITKKFMFNTSTRLKMSDVILLYNKINKPELKYPEFEPVNVQTDGKSFMNMINKRDVLVHHPYESFNSSVLKLIQEACTDPYVVSIKQILYRSGNDSKILRYLIKAAQSGKNVVVVVELKARFDEEVNIEWADKLKKAGAIVVYGYEHIKTHAKLIHIFRFKDSDAQQFVHIGTGNYSEKNSRIYTDFGYFTSNKKICSDVNNVFNMLTGGYISDKVIFDKIKISPLYNREYIYQLIDEESKKGKDGNIVIKVNNISDEGIISKLYEASNAGVNISIVCRGSCSLIPNLKSFSENINVISIVGRFLEHSRMMIFGKGNSLRVFITSSDLMPRNLNRRVEVLFEVESPDLKQKLAGYMLFILEDDYNSYTMTSDGEYTKNVGDVNSQQNLIDYHKILSNTI